ncbi:MAG: glycoside hydrolase family 172 protein, partial [Isosphaeraceae bacterium]
MALNGYMLRIGRTVDGIALFSVLIFSPGWARADDEAITVETLLWKMMDTRWLAVPPQPGERTVQFSSYDRATRLEGGKIVNPFANGDAGHYLRVEGKGDHREWVLAEAKGPGYVSRIWSANPDGELRIYIDGNPKPALAASFPAITNGEIEPFGAPFGHDASRGRNLYFPFPFAKSIKITTTRGKQYFQVSVTTFAEGTKVESYSPEVLRRASEVIEETRQGLLHPVLHRPPIVGPSERRVRVQVPAGETRDLLGEDWSGGHGGAIKSLALRVRTPDLEEALARTMLTISFDGAPEPQVAVPLGEFFGTGPGANDFESSIHRVVRDGSLVSSWYMPYHKSVRICLTNSSSQGIMIHAGLRVDRELPPENSLYFHARWRYQDGLQTKKADGTLDWPALRVSGATGRFVGLLVDIFNPTPAWWGEGDEKIYVDGELFPSTIGTGTEDYFGYAWGNPQPYANPFHAQTRCDGPGSKGNTSNIRYQILDSVPF